MIISVDNKREIQSITLKNSVFKVIYFDLNRGKMKTEHFQSSDELLKFLTDYWRNDA